MARDHRRLGAPGLIRVWLLSSTPDFRIKGEISLTSGSARRCAALSVLAWQCCICGIGQVPSISYASTRQNLVWADG